MLNDNKYSSSIDTELLLSVELGNQWIFVLAFSSDGTEKTGV